MKLLLNFGIQNFPQISATAKADLVHQDLTKGPWAMAMAPMAFAKRYKLLKEKIPVVSEMSLMKDAKIKVTVVRSKASRVFVMQLGKLWKGVEALPPHTKALFAAFAARAARDADASRKLLDKLALSFHSGKLDFAGVDNLIKKYGNEKIVVEAISKHAYVLTAMAALLEKARMDGVLSTADFLWLKAVDRKLWFMLNCIGRQTAFTEISGPFAHWLAEREVGRSLKIPVIDKAIDALDEAIQNIIYNPKTND
jgi:intracellular multiplication protein IcmP